MISPLEILHVELLQEVVSYLDLPGIASLRLASRTLEAKASGGERFNSFFRCKKIELTTAALQEFVRVTGEFGHRGRLLRHCTITGVIEPGQTTAQDGVVQAEHAGLLAEAFGNLKHGYSGGALASLCLEVSVRIDSAEGERLARPGEPKFTDWRRVWDTAVSTFHIAIEALRESQLRVYDHLDIFGSLRGCSLSCEVFIPAFPAPAPTGIFASLRRLTASLSEPQEARVPQPPWHDEEDSDADEIPSTAEPPVQYWPKNHALQGILLHVLPTMPKLESLDLHWYSLGKTTLLVPATSASPHRGSHIPDVTDLGLVLPRLKQCSLGGIYASEADLLRFLEAVRPESVTLACVRLVSGTYASIFGYLTSPDSPVTYYRLDDLFERTDLDDLFERTPRRLVHFDAPGSPKFPYAGGPVGPSSLARPAREGEAIRYRFPTARVKGSPQRLRWLRGKGQEFGPPVGQSYDFIALNAPPPPPSAHPSDDSDFD